MFICIKIGKKKNREKERNYSNYLFYPPTQPLNQIRFFFVFVCLFVCFCFCLFVFVFLFCFGFFFPHPMGGGTS